MGNVSFCNTHCEYMFPDALLREKSSISITKEMRILFFLLLNTVYLLLSFHLSYTAAHLFMKHTTYQVKDIASKILLVSNEQKVHKEEILTLLWIWIILLLFILSVTLKFLSPKTQGS